MAGSGETGVITATPFVNDPTGTSKAIVCGAPAHVWALVSASRSEPAPESVVFVTVKVVARRVAAAVRSSIETLRASGFSFGACRSEQPVLISGLPFQDSMTRGRRPHRLGGNSNRA